MWCCYFNNIILISLIFLSCSVHLTIENYLAGVYEHHLPLPSTVEHNLNRFKIVIEDAKQLGVDILVFPENGLIGNVFIPDRKVLFNYSTNVPNPSNKTIPCLVKNAGLYSNVLTELSCLARTHHMYLVVNLAEQLACNNQNQKELNDNRACAKDKMYYFNTNVAFDRNGAVIARYRKFNLFGENLYNITNEPTISIFTTDFNETFGLFTCFDILFKTPALTLVEKYGVKNVIFPTRWMAELPFLTALQIQQGWSYATNTTLLASNINNPGQGSTGSSIYRARTGQNLMYVTGERQSTLIVTTISNNSKENFNIITYPQDGLPTKYENTFPKINNSNLNEIKMVPYQLTDYDSKQLVFKNGVNYIEERLCQNKVCCTLNAKVNFSALKNGSSAYKYRFVVRDGVRSFSGQANGGLKVCAIVACTTDESNSCGKRFSNYNETVWPIQYESITIVAEMPEDKNVVYFPNSLNSSLIPLSDSSWTWTRNNLKTLTYRMEKSVHDLLTFGIYGRNFHLDKSGTSFKYANCILISIMAFIIIKEL